MSRVMNLLILDLQTIYYHLLPAGLHTAHYSVVQKWGFSPRTGPQGRHIAPINVKFGTGERTAGQLPHAKTVKIRILPINLPTQGRLVCTIL